MDVKDYRFTREHEWLRPEPDNLGTMGITDYAQSQLGDIVYLELPAVGTQVTQSAKMGEIEAVKAVTEFYSPASGRVTETNQTAVASPNLVNEDPFGKGWLVRLELSQPSELDALMNYDQYRQFVAREV
ncbi:MAG: glycine cleavage system protein GcvH [Chloroflexi bacterium]|nr:glycine cleavage system protein GcvH [Chloroflexota bacterium]